MRITIVCKDLDDNLQTDGPLPYEHPTWWDNWGPILVPLLVYCVIVASGLLL